MEKKSGQFGFTPKEEKCLIIEAQIQDLSARKIELEQRREEIESGIKKMKSGMVDIHYTQREELQAKLRETISTIEKLDTDLKELQSSL